MYLSLKKIDWPLVFIVLLLSGVGLFTIFNLSPTDPLIYFKRQLLFLVLGLLIMFGLSFFDYRIFKNHSFVLFIIYLVSLALLISVLFMGKEIRGASSWFDFGPLNFEPIEFIKIVIILLLAKYFSLRHIEMYRIRHLVVSGIYVALPILVIFLQPDFGSALVLFFIWLGIIIISGIKIRHLAVLFLVVMVLVAGSWFWFLKDYQKQRVLTFLNPGADPYGRGYQMSQSLITIGSGGLFGQKDGSQTALRFLPERHTDFIFASLAERRGLAGVFFLLLFFTLLFWRIIKIALESLNNFSRLFASGLAIMIFAQLIINIGMNLGVLPITGLTLPLVSYGGSSLISIFIGLGILQSIKCRSGM